MLLIAGAAEASASGWPGLLAAGACLGLFAYELLTTVVRRLARRSTLAGDRDHAYDRLAARVDSAKTSTELMWTAGGTAVLIALAIAEIPAIAVATAIAVAIHVPLGSPISEAER